MTFFNTKFHHACKEGAIYAKTFVDKNYLLKDIKVSVRIHLLALGYSPRVAEKSAQFILFGN